MKQHNNAQQELNQNYCHWLTLTHFKPCNLKKNKNKKNPVTKTSQFHFIELCKRREKNILNTRFKHLTTCDNKTLYSRLLSTQSWFHFDRARKKQIILPFEMLQLLGSFWRAN